MGAHQARRYGWHVLSGRSLPHGDGRYVRPGQALTVDGRVALCEHGLHASPTPWEAFSYVQGFYVCRVVVSGIPRHRGSDMAARKRKFVGTRRLVVWMARLTTAERTRLSLMRFSALGRSQRAQKVQRRFMRVVLGAHRLAPPRAKKRAA